MRPVRRSLGTAIVLAAVAWTGCTSSEEPVPTSTSVPTGSPAREGLRVEEFDVPGGAHPHDVAPAPDGSVWFTAQVGNYLGSLDPSTGKVTRIDIRSSSRPHGVITGPDGAAWVTAQGSNAIVRVDLKTHAVRTFRVPRADVGVHTATFSDDDLWFTGNAGFIGKLDMDTGHVDVFDAPRGSGPYGITGTPSGDVYYAALGGSFIARIDQRTGASQRLEPPTPDQGARRVWADSRGRIWVSEWNAGKLARYDPSSRSWKEWKLPGPKPMAYAVFVDDEDIVWVTDFGSNAIQRFDPRTERFTTVALPSAGAEVRQLLGRPGEVWGAESGTDKLVVVRTG